MRQFSCFLLPVACFCMIAMFGCGNPDAKYSKVEGVVTYNQQPVEGAAITFMPVNYTDGVENASGRTDASGRFALTSTGAVSGGTGILPGEYNVVVSKVVMPPDPDQEAFDRGEITYDQLQDRLARNSTRSNPSKNVLPGKYNSPTTSGLKATVVSGKNPSFDFDLTD